MFSFCHNFCWLLGESFINCENLTDYDHKDTARYYQHGTDDDLQRRLFVQEKEGKQNSNHHAQLVDRCHTGDISQLNCLE